MPNRPKEWTVVVLSENQAKMRQFRLNRKWFILGVGAVIAVVTMLFVFAGMTWSLSMEARDTEAMESRILELETTNQRVRELAERLSELKQFEQQLRRGLQMPQGSLPPSEALEPSESSGIISPEDDPHSSEDFLSIYQERIAEISTESVLPSDIPTHPPVRGYVTRSFENSHSLHIPGHLGLDVAAKVGTSINASANGLVVFAGWSYPLGNLVIVAHKSGYTTFYGHNQAILVEPGERVLMGQPIATLGNSGRSSAPHLHFEIWKDGSRLNPESVLSRAG